MFSIPLLSLFLLSLSGVLGNTEIVNFSATEDSTVDLPFTSSWSILRPKAQTLIWNVSSAPLGSKLPQELCANLDQWHPIEKRQLCRHELWVVLDLDQDEWKGFDKFTLRLSWPAFHPTDTFMKIYDPTSLSAFSKKPFTPGSDTTRRKYARIQMVHTGVLTPTSGNVLDDVSRYEVPIHLILEPLHFGVLPASVVPVVIAILAAIAIGLPAAMKINSYLQRIVQKAKVESRAQLKVD